MADPASLTLAAIATADQCIRLVGVLRSKYQDYQSADRELSEMVLSFEYHSIKIDRQVKFLRQIWRGLDGELQILQNHVFHVLSQKLQEAVAMLDTVIGRKDETEDAALRNLRLNTGAVRMMKYTLGRKECLRTTLDEINKWQLMFDPAWVLLTRQSDELLDNTLRQYGSEDESAGPLVALRKMRQIAARTHDTTRSRASIKDQIDASSLATCQDASTGVVQLRSGEDVLVPTFVPDPRSVLTDVRQDIEQLDLSLSQSEPMTFGLLRSLGVVDRMSSDNTQDSLPLSDQAATHRPRPVFHFIFQIPFGLEEPQTLRSLLISGSTPSLNSRLAIAQCLSNAIMFLHSSFFVHKNIRPETIMCFRIAESMNYAPFLVGFEEIRVVQGQSLLLGNDFWERNLYRHPARQGTWPQDKYVMQHDVYSLGVVLLEIGMWTSFVVEDKERNCGRAGIPAIAKHLDEPNQRLRSQNIKGEFVQLAKTQLPITMGNKYRDIVVSCLTCLDLVEPGFGHAKEFRDKDKVAIRVRFAEKVIVELNGISI